MQRHLELRKVPEGSLWNVENILEINNDWQIVALFIPKDLQSPHFEQKYNFKDMRDIKEHAKNTNKKCAKVLFDEWGSSGRVRPTVEALMKILVQARIFRAADEIARMLGEPPPPRPTQDVKINISKLLNDISVEQRLNSMASIQTDDLHNSSHDIVYDHTSQTRAPSELNLETIHSTDSNLPYFSALQTLDLSNLNTTQMLPDFIALLNKIHEFNSIRFDSQTSNSHKTERESSQVHMTPRNELHQLSRGNLLHAQNRLGTIDNDILEDKKLGHFEYRELEAITNQFSETFIDKPVGPVGKIGSGGFGEVYVGTHSVHGALAVKRFRIQLPRSSKTAMDLFNTEVKSLSHLRHENIVPIFGYSIDGPTPCIVCKYVEGGSLQQKIAAKVLTEVQRVNIMRGTAEGLQYIHHSKRPPQPEDTESQADSTKKSYYLHGDVKSANILLTKDCVPKLCDFGLAKHLETTLIITKTMMGTSAYMAPEGFTGTVTQKNDIFSFGIVLLELLTGCKPIIIARGENKNIKDYVEENCINGDITKLLDKVVNKWTIAMDVYNLAQRCLEEQMKRPTINEVCEIVIGICQKPYEVISAQV